MSISDVRLERTVQLGPHALLDDLDRIIDLLATLAADGASSADLTAHEADEDAHHDKTHWSTHADGGDDEGKVEELATDGDEGQMFRASGSGAVEVTDRILVDDGSDAITDLDGNADTEAAIHKDGILISKRAANMHERALTEPLLNCDMEDVTAGALDHWDLEIGDSAGAEGVVDTTRYFKGSQSWQIFSDTPVM